MGTFGSARHGRLDGGPGTSLRFTSRAGLSLLVLLILLNGSLHPSLPEAHAQSLVATAALGNTADGFAYDSAKGEIFVVNDSSGMAVLSDSNNQFVAKIPLQTPSQQPAYDSSNGDIYVGTGSYAAGNPRVSVISDESNTVVATIPIGFGASYLTYDPSKNEIFASEPLGDAIQVISDKSNSVVATINFGSAHPENSAYDSGKGELFVSDTNPNEVSIVSDSTNVLVANVSIAGGGSGAIAYDSGKGEVFVTNGIRLVSIISDSTNAIVANLTANTIHGLAYDAAKSEMFMSSLGPSSVGLVSAISDSTNRIVANVTLTAPPLVLVYDSGKGEIFGGPSTPTVIYVISDSQETSSTSTTAPEFPAAFLPLLGILALGTVAVMTGRIARNRS